MHSKKIIAAIVLVSFIPIMIVVNMTYTRCIHYLSLFLSLSPTIYILVEAYDAKKHKKAIKIEMGVVSMFLVTYTLLMLSTVAICDRYMYITNSKYYSRCMVRYKDDELMSCFPTKLPKNAGKPQFADHPGIGKTRWVAISYKTTEEEIDRYIESYKDQSIYYGSYRETLMGGRFVAYKPPNCARLMVTGDCNEYQLILLNNEDLEDYHRGDYECFYRGIILSKSQKEVVVYFWRW